MLNFTEQNFIDKMSKMPEELQKKLLLLSYDGSFLSIINYKNVKPTEVISAIDYATKVTALGFASKQEMFNIIEDAIGDEDETRHIFGEIDRTILVPNNLDGAEELKPKEDLTLYEDDFTEPNTTETAEDILREIENPTPSPLILPRVITPAPQAPVPTTTPATEPALVTPPTTPIPTEATPPQQEPAPNKETQLDSKLTDTAVQTPKSTYYKVDPYREQAEK